MTRPFFWALSTICVDVAEGCPDDCVCKLEESLKRGKLERVLHSATSNQVGVISVMAVLLLSLFLGKDE